jgi:hypothetical protein
MGDLAERVNNQLNDVKGASSSDDNQKGCKSSKRKKSTDRAAWAKRPARGARVLELAIEQKNKGKGNGTTFKSDGWSAIVDGFCNTEFEEDEQLVKISHDQEQIQHFLGVKKEEWTNWNKLKNIDSGLGWDNVMNRVDCSDQVWDTYVQAHPWAAKYRKLSFPDDFDAMDQLFNGAVATGSKAVKPSEAAEQSDDSEDELSSDEHNQSKSSDCNTRKSRPSRYPRMTTGQQLVKVIEKAFVSPDKEKACMPNALEKLVEFKDVINDENLMDQMFLFLSVESNAKSFMALIAQKKSSEIIVKWLKLNSSMWMAKQKMSADREI